MLFGFSAAESLADVAVRIILLASAMRACCMDRMLYTDRSGQLYQSTRCIVGSRMNVAVTLSSFTLLSLESSSENLWSWLIVFTKLRVAPVGSFRAGSVSCIAKGLCSKTE